MWTVLRLYKDVDYYAENIWKSSHTYVILLTYELYVGCDSQISGFTNGGQ